MDYGRNVQSVMAMTIYLNWYKKKPWYHDKSMYLLDSEKAFCRRCCGHGGWNWPLPFLLNSQIFRTPLLHDKWWQCSDSALWWWLVSSFYLLVRSSNDSFLLFLSWYLSSSSWMNLFFFKLWKSLFHVPYFNSSWTLNIEVFTRLSAEQSKKSNCATHFFCVIIQRHRWVTFDLCIATILNYFWCEKWLKISCLTDDSQGFIVAKSRLHWSFRFLLTTTHERRDVNSRIFARGG